MNAKPRVAAAAGLLVAALLTVFSVLSLFTPNRADAEGTFIPAKGRVDMVYDLKRDTVYITQKTHYWDPVQYKDIITDSGIVRYHLGTRTLLPRIELYGDLMGIDLSPDGNTLAVADLLYSTNQVWIHLIDLNTQQIRQVTFGRSFYEGGTFAVAFGSDGAVLVSSTFLGSGWVPLRRYDPATDTTTVVVPSVRQSTMVSASADGRYIGFAESNSSAGPLGYYRVDTGTVAASGWGTGWFNYEIGVNRDGTQFAVPTYNGTYIYNRSLAQTGLVGTYAAAQPIGVAYHPLQDVVYFTWADGYYSPQPHRFVKAHRTSDFAVLRTFDFEYTFQHPGNHAFGSGRLRIAPDGSYLFGTVGEPTANLGGGVRFVQLGSHAPVARAQHLRTREDTPVSFTLNGASASGGLSFQVVSPPAHGTLSGIAPDLTYTPGVDFNGADSFTFQVSDATGTGNTAEVTLAVSPVNDAPSFVKGSDQVVTRNAGPQSVPGWATSISPGPADESGQTLTFQVFTPSQNHFSAQPAVSPNGTLTYTPATNVSGTATVTVSLRDNGGTANGGVNTSAAQTFTITIQAPNQPPSAIADSATTAEDTAVDVDVLGNDTDPDGDPLSLNSATPGAHGTTEIVAGKVRYSPDPNYNGPDSFSYTVSDGNLTSTAQVSVTVTPVNDPPSAANDGATTPEDTALTVDALGNDTDPDGDTLTVTAVGPAAHGTAALIAGVVTYEPALNYHGGDSFTYTIEDGNGGSATATVNIGVTPVNDAPAANGQSVSTNEDTALPITLSGSDVEGDPLTFSVVNGPAHGTLSGSGAQRTYTPAPNYHGPDSFTFKVNDGSADSNTATVQITVNPVNDPPLAVPDSATTGRNTAVTIAVRTNDSDPDADPLTVTAVTQPLNGSVAITGGTVRYTPKKNFWGTDTFQYTISDGKGGTASAAVTVTVLKR